MTRSPSFRVQSLSLFRFFEFLSAWGYTLPSLQGFCPPINGGTEGGVKTIEGKGVGLLGFWFFLIICQCDDVVLEDGESHVGSLLLEVLVSCVADATTIDS